MKNSASLIDTGVLVALVDKGSNEHQECLQVFAALSLPPLTTWACLTEAFYLIGKLCGWDGQVILLGLLTEKAINIYPPAENEIVRISELMRQYRDTPMDFADASLVSLYRARALSELFLHQATRRKHEEKPGFDGLSSCSFVCLRGGEKAQFVTVFSIQTCLRANGETKSPFPSLIDEG